MAKAPKAKKANEAPVEGRVVAAAMTAGAAGGIGGGLIPPLTGKDIEQAMADAHHAALAKGIVDDAKILKLRLQAREDIKKDHRAAEAAAQKEAKGSAE